MKTSTLFLTNKGFSLLQIMITLGISSILLLAVSQFAADSFQMVTGMKKSLSIEDTIATVRQTLSKNGECTFNLGGKGLNLSASGATGLSLTEFQHHNPGGAPTGRLIRTGAIGDGTTLTGIRLTRVAAIAPDIMASNLTFTFDKGAGHVQTREKTIPLVVKEKGGQITECWMREFSPHYVLDLICRRTSDDGLSEGYDLQNEECEVTPSRWISGNLNSAICTSGYQTRPGADDSDCRATFTGTFTDNPQYSVSAPSTSGVALTTSRPAAIAVFNSATRSCTCAYGSDIPNPQATCAIRCVEE